MMYKLSLDKLYDFFDKISEKEILYIPSDDSDGSPRFKKYVDGVTLSESGNTVRSAKDFFFHQTENLVDFKIDGQKIEVIDPRTENEDFVIFGVRSCDARSFKILDKVFIDQEPADSYYLNRRSHGTVITLACTAPAETCFCKTFGIDATESADGDITAWKTSDELILKAVSEKGRALLESLEEIIEKADSTDEKTVEAQKTQTNTIYDKLPLHNLSTEKFDGRSMMDTFSSEKWKELSEACLGCGTCTFVCPTCQCYDIKEFDTGHGIKRFRCWDSCMYSDFTKMAGGQPRLTQLERFRQRFMHKLIYFPMNNDGEYGCVGCGRCLAKCPIHMNIVKVMKSIGEDE